MPLMRKRRKRWCVSLSGLQEESVALTSSGIADCEKRQRVLGSLSVALVEGRESDGADTNLRFHAASGVMASRELGVVHFLVCATELGVCNGRLQSGSSRAEGHPLHV